MLAIHIACVRSANERQDLVIHGTKIMQSAETLVPVAEHVCLPKFLKKGSVCICNGHSDVSFQELISLAQKFSLRRRFNSLSSCGRKLWSTPGVNL